MTNLFNLGIDQNKPKSQKCCSWHIKKF